MRALTSLWVCPSYERAWITERHLTLPEQAKPVTPVCAWLWSRRHCSPVHLPSIARQTKFDSAAGGSYRPHAVKDLQHQLHIIAHQCVRTDINAKDHASLVCS